jgi:hypothetical protein
MGLDVSGFRGFVGLELVSFGMGIGNSRKPNLLSRWVNFSPGMKWFCVSLLCICMSRL